MVRERVVDARLEQVHFGEDHLVVELLELAQERLNQRERLAVVVVVNVSARPVSSALPPRAQAAKRDAQRDETRLEVLLEEDALLRLGPVDILLRHVNLQHAAVRDRGEEVEEGADWGVGRTSARLGGGGADGARTEFCGLGLGEVLEQWS